MQVSQIPRQFHHENSAFTTAAAQHPQPTFSACMSPPPKQSSQFGQVFEKRRCRCTGHNFRPAAGISSPTHTHSSNTLAIPRPLKPSEGNETPSGAPPAQPSVAAQQFALYCHGTWALGGSQRDESCALRWEHIMPCSITWDLSCLLEPLHWGPSHSVRPSHCALEPQQST